MPKERFSPEQIIATLHQIEVQLAQGKSIVLACKEAPSQNRTKGRVSQVEDFREAEGSAGSDWRLVRSLRSRAAPLISRLRAARTRDIGRRRTATTHSRHQLVMYPSAYPKSRSCHLRPSAPDAIPLVP
jgi:hypothetical protein